MILSSVLFQEWKVKHTRTHMGRLYRTDPLHFQAICLSPLLFQA